jgi:hypothetical protein
VYTQIFRSNTFFWIGISFLHVVAVYLASVWWSPVRWAAVVSVALLALTSAPLFPDILFFSLALMIFFLALNGRAPRPVVTILTAGLVLPCLAKFNFFVISLPLMGLADLAAILRKTRFYGVTLVLFIFIVILYVISGQPLVAFGEFVLGSLDVANGYGQTMGNYWWTSQQTAIVIVSFAILAGAVVVTRNNSDQILRYVALLGLSWYLFVVFKSGNVRAGHQFITWGAMTASACFFFMLPVPLRSVRRWTVVASGSYAVLCLLAYQYLINEPDLNYILHKRVTQLEAQIVSVSAWGRPIKHFKELTSLRTSAEEQLAHHAPPNLLGTVGSVPWDFSEIIAAGYDFVPQPSLQQYSSYTARLRALDMQHFAGDSRPDNLLFRLETIDQRYRTIELGPSLPQILAGYDLVTVVPGSSVLLRRRAVSRPIEVHKIEESSASMGDWIPIPDLKKRFAFLSIHLTERIRGRLLAFLYKQSSFELKLKFANGEEIKSRFFPNLVADGFLVLSPDTSEVPLFIDAERRTSEFSEDALKAIRVNPADLAAFGFTSTYSLIVSSVSIQGESEHPRSSAEPMLSLLAGTIVRTTGVRLIGDRLLAHSPTIISVKLTGGARLSGEFGLFDSAWQEGNPTPVKFTISGSSPGGAAHPL